jgi:hypothetical protein
MAEIALHGEERIMPVVTAYTADALGRPSRAEATIAVVGALAGGTVASVPDAQVYGHLGTGHPYHHERGHLIGKQLGGDGGDAQNLVGLSDGTNAPLMAEIEGHCRDIIDANPGGTVFLRVDVDWAATYYNGPAAAPFVVGLAPWGVGGLAGGGAKGTVGRITVTIYSADPAAGGALLFSQGYPNGVVKNHAAAGCC